MLRVSRHLGIWGVVTVGAVVVYLVPMVAAWSVVVPQLVAVAKESLLLN